MGVGGHFWDLLKPYTRTEDSDFLRSKRVAVDLSFWIVQHETAIRAHVRNPHMRLTFFRTINLFSKFGAFPVFVVDGTPSPLKSQARIARFFQASGLGLSSLPVPEEGVSVKRNPSFLKCVRESVELLELLGMPILKAKGEAEALCAQLNREGQVDACITADSDAFLFGAHCVVKLIRPNSNEPFECYHISDIEAGLGLKRKHLIAISLLVGNDHDLKGVQGIGLDTALRFVKCFSEDEILTRLSEIGRRDTVLCFPSLHENSSRKKCPHCSLCGHPGSKRAHLKLACEPCSSCINEGCTQKPAGFKCSCTSCDLDRIDKEQKKNENWQVKVCQKISMEQNFPNAEIVEMFLSKSNCDFSANDRLNLAWESPKTELLVDYLAFHQQWEPSYIRQRILPMLSTIFLREMASNPTKALLYEKDLLYDQYTFDSVQRLKISYGHQSFVVKWKKSAPAMDNTIYTVHTKESEILPETDEHNESTDSLEEIDAPKICLDDGCWFLSTDENMELVKAAFPEKVERFLKEKEQKEKKSRRKKVGTESGGIPPNLKSPKTRNVQLSITEFYRSTKVVCQGKRAENLAEKSENGIGSSE